MGFGGVAFFVEGFDLNGGRGSQDQEGKANEEGDWFHCSFSFFCFFVLLIWAKTRYLNLGNFKFEKGLKFKKIEIWTFL